MAAPTLPQMMVGACTSPAVAADSAGGHATAEDTKQRYCLKWNNYQSNVTTTFKELLAVEDFVDITLSAEGGALRAHKVVLSACSPYFRDILKVSREEFNVAVAEILSRFILRGFRLGSIQSSS